MPDIPITGELEDANYIAGNAYNALQAKYVDANAWATWAATQIQDNLHLINTTTNDFDVAPFLQAAEDAIGTIPTITVGTITYTAPTAGTFLAPPSPTPLSVGTVPITTVDFDNPEFVDNLLDTLKNKLTNDLLSASTGLGDAEAALFQREMDRQAYARLIAYNEATTAFTARCFELPQGALLAKQTELNNESGIRLSDASSQIMAESARLAQAWNQTAVTAATQVVDVLSKIHDSKINRNFEAAKSTVMLAIEGFKADVQALVSEAQLQGHYIASVTGYNQAIAQVYSAEISGAAADVSAQAEREKAVATVADISSRKAVAIADIATKFAMSNIEAAVRKYTGEIQVLQAVAQSMAQMVASALNSVNVSSSYSMQGSMSNSSSVSEDINATRTGNVHKSESVSISN